MLSIDIDSYLNGRRVQVGDIVTAFRQACIEARISTDAHMDVVRLAVEEIVEEAKERIYNRILTMPNKTKEDGRVDTWDMISAVDIRIISVGQYGGFLASVGWFPGSPYYTIFQELGTRRNLEGMNAIGDAFEYMYSELQNIESRM